MQDHSNDLSAIGKFIAGEYECNFLLVEIASYDCSITVNNNFSVTKVDPVFWAWAFDLATKKLTGIMIVRTTLGNFIGNIFSGLNSKQS